MSGMKMYVIVVSRFFQCMGFVQHEGGTIPCTVKSVVVLIDRIRLTTRLASALECLYCSTYSTQLFTVCCSYSSMA